VTSSWWTVRVVNLIHVGQGDVEGSTIFHVPSADAVVCGDVVYNNVQMMMYEADEAKRAAWIASIDAVAALNPKIDVAGHKSVGAPDLPDNLVASQQYLRDFTTLAKEGRHGGRPSPRHARLARNARADAHAMDLGPSRSRPRGLTAGTGSFAVHTTIRPLALKDREAP
jgi:hypothetical protein